jgi:anti-anti-sigma factor
VTAEVVLTGELDISTFDKAQEQIEEAEHEAPELLIIDLTELQFVGSTGFRLILLADQRAQQVGRRLAIRLGRGPALRVFAVLGLTDHFDVLDGQPKDTSPGPTRA